MSFGLFADIASVAGLVITLVGFAVTIWNTGKAKEAAEEARQAAREAVARIGERLLDQELSDIIAFLTEIEGACRDSDWGVALVRTADVRIRLATCVEHFALNEKERDDLEAFLEQVPEFKRSLERVKRTDSTFKQLPKRQLDTLNNLVMRLGQVRGRIQSGVFNV